MKENLTFKLLNIYENESKKSSYIPLQDLPSLIGESLICVEDHRFYQHCGIDLIAICRAFLTNLLNLRIIEGGSTLTQQLVRRLLLSKEKFFQRKWREIIIAINLEKKLSKKQILEFYLNTCYFLSIDKIDVFGVHAAAKGIFNKDCKNLNLAESSFLAALIGRPLTNRSPIAYVMRTIYRQHLILRYLLEYGRISRSDFDMAINENIKIFDQFKNDLPLDQIQDYNFYYIKPYYFIKPIILFIKFLARRLRLIKNMLCYYPIIFVMSQRYRLAFALIKIVIEKESSFIPRAISTKGAKGLMQVMDGTFKYICKKYDKQWSPVDIFKPSINIEAGTLYLKEMIGYFTPKVQTGCALHYALAAYNAGPHNIDKVIDLIIKNDAQKDWQGLKQYLPSITHRYALYTIRYVESIVIISSQNGNPISPIPPVISR